MKKIRKYKRASQAVDETVFNLVLKDVSKGINLNVLSAYYGYSVGSIRRWLRHGNWNNYLKAKELFKKESISRKNKNTKKESVVKNPETTANFIEPEEKSSVEPVLIKEIVGLNYQIQSLTKAVWALNFKLNPEKEKPEIKKNMFHGFLSK